MRKFLFWAAVSLAYPFRRQILWLVLDGPIRLPGSIAPWLFGIAMGSKPVRVEKDEPQ